VRTLLKNKNTKKHEAIIFISKEKAKKNNNIRKTFLVMCKNGILKTIEKYAYL